MAPPMSTLPKPDPAPLAYFDPGDGRRIAYRHRPAKAKIKGPTLVFLPGYASDMEGTKASEIDAFAAAAGLASLRLDYSGTGSSGGDFAEGTLDRWLDEVVSAIDMLVEGPVLLIGSSMGGWLALHAALKRPDRVKARGRHRRRARLHRLGLYARGTRIPGCDRAHRAARPGRRAAASHACAVRCIRHRLAPAPQPDRHRLPGAADPRRQG